MKIKDLDGIKFKTNLLNIPLLNITIYLKENVNYLR